MLFRKRFNPFSLIACTSVVIALSACSGGTGSSDDVSGGGTTGDTGSDQGMRIEHLSAGEATVDMRNANAFSEHSNNLTDGQKIVRFNLGNDFFENPWIAGNASTSSRDGLGGLFNNNACQNCHVRDGRGHAPDAEGSTIASSNEGADFGSILFRAARTSLSDEQRRQMQTSLLANVGDSSVGGQLQHESVIGVAKEASLGVSYRLKTISFVDGTEVELRDPDWHLVSLQADTGHDFDDDTLFSARVAPPMSGLGLLALVSEMDIVALEDPSDQDSDGISGVANYVWSVKDERARLGRFGWKAGQPSLLEQTAGAFVNDMGLTSRLQLAESCLPHQEDCLNTPNGNGDSVNHYDYEVPDTVLDAVAFYSAHLAVPARRNAYSDEVQAGKALFNRAGCAKCHVAEYTTENSEEFPELSGQKIFPYTDMLLHDMGEDLADFTRDNQAGSTEQKVEFLASAREWRTPPLWGIGLAKTVDPKATFLHDGRARTILEAVLWHGGEAEQSLQNVLRFSASERAQLLAFLNDL